MFRAVRPGQYPLRVNTKTQIAMLAETKNSDEIAGAIRKLGRMKANEDFSYRTIQDVQKVLVKAKRQAERDELIQELFQ